MYEELIDTFADLSIENKRNLVFNLIQKMDLLLCNVDKDSITHRDVMNYVYKEEDESKYLTELYKNLYNLTENLVDYMYHHKHGN